MANLYIIGNGFDMAHGIKSSCNNFKKYLQSYCGNEYISTLTIPSIYSRRNDTDNIETAKMLIKLITIAENGSYWSDLENSLEKIDYYRFFEKEVSDEYNKIVAQSLEISVLKIKYFFEEWIKTLNYSNVEKIQSFYNFIDPEEDYFITFNYTPLLEKIYGVKKVCHIHGKTEENIIFGYGYGKYPYLTDQDIKMCLLKLNYNDQSKRNIIRNIQSYARSQRLFINYFPKEIIKENIRPNDDSYYNKEIIEYINACIQRIKSSLEKDVYAGLDNLIQYINMERNIDINKIYSIGFSYSDVDMKAIQLISMFGGSEWNIDNYSEKRANEYISKVKKIFKNRISKFDFKKLPTL